MQYVSTFHQKYTGNNQTQLQQILFTTYKIIRLLLPSLPYLSINNNNGLSTWKQILNVYLSLLKEILCVLEVTDIVSRQFFGEL